MAGYVIKFGHRRHVVSTDNKATAFAVVDSLLVKGWQLVTVNGVSGLRFLKEG